MRRFVVTGALGHIGSRLIRELPAAFPGSELLLIDDLSARRYASLFHLPPRGRYRFLEADILKADLAEIFSGADAVVHLAAVTDAASSFDDPKQVERVNVRGTERVARACLKTGSPLIFLSTTSIYGPRSRTVDEDCPPGDLRPQSPYAASKLRAERLLARLARSKRLRHVTCRFGTIFGPSPGMRFDTAVNKFIWQACTDRPLTVWRTALRQRRPYLDLGDAVRAVLFILRNDVFDGRVYNVLTANATVAEILGHIRRRVPTLRVQRVDSRIMNQLSYDVRSERFQSLGFQFKGSLARGIAATMDLLGAARKRGRAVGSKP